MIIKNLFILSVCLLLGLIVGTILSIVVINLLTPCDWNVDTLQKTEDLTPNTLKILLTINHLSTFTTGALLFYILNSRKRISLYFGFSTSFNIFLLCTFTMLLWLTYPVSAWLVDALQEWPLVQEFEVERNNQMILESILTTNNLQELVVNLIIIGAIPALGEELVFRGIVQRMMLLNISNPHVAILISSIVFSAFHLEILGFLPKLLIGLILGYAYYWTKNIWYPISLHFINNGTQVLAIYWNGIPAIESRDYNSVSGLMALICFATLLIIVILLDKYFPNGKRA